jgi:hypothetical protein
LVKKMKPALPSTEEAKPRVIPTLSRSRIPRNLSYPIGAEAISEELALVPQFSELQLIFFLNKFDIDIRSGRGRFEQPSYEFIRVEYLKDAKPGGDWPIRRLYGRPPRSRWGIVVQPVSRVLWHRISEYIIESTLPIIRDWLMDRSGLIRNGSDLLAFFYDEGLEEFVSRRSSGLEPIRARRAGIKASDGRKS